jgi:hypothetical protein
MDFNRRALPKDPLASLLKKSGFSIYLFSLGHNLQGDGTNVRSGTTISDPR